MMQEEVQSFDEIGQLDFAHLLAKAKGLGKDSSEDEAEEMAGPPRQGSRPPSVTQHNQEVHYVHGRREIQALLGSLHHHAHVRSAAISNSVERRALA